MTFTINLTDRRNGPWYIENIINCKTIYGIDEIVYFCRKCGDILEIKFDFKELAETLKESSSMSRPLRFGVTAISCLSMKPQKLSH